MILFNFKFRFYFLKLELISATGTNACCSAGGVGVIFCYRCAAGAEFCVPKCIAATPATYGAAKDVPLFEW